MKLKILLPIAIVAAASAAFAWKYIHSESVAKPLAIIVPATPGEFDHSHAQLTRVLQQFVKDQNVDYAGIKGDPDSLGTYLGDLAAVDEVSFDAWTKEQRLAYLINLYNAATIALVVQQYPIDSIKDIGNVVKGPWDQPVVPLFGKMVTLNHIEHGLIRVNYDEPRAHFGLVCASVGCPPLRNEAFVSERLGDQMDEQGTIFFATESKNRLDADAGILYLSPIFKWFKEDFTTGGGSLEKFVAPYFSEADRNTIVSGALKIKYTDYDWSLNKQ